MCLHESRTVIPTEKEVKAWKVLDLEKDNKGKPKPKYCYAEIPLQISRWMKAKPYFGRNRGFHVLPTRLDAKHWLEIYNDYDCERNGIIVRVTVKRIFKKGKDEKEVNGNHIPCLLAEYMKISKKDLGAAIKERNNGQR